MQGAPAPPVAFACAWVTFVVMFFHQSDVNYYSRHLPENLCWVMHKNLHKFIVTTTVIKNNHSAIAYDVLTTGAQLGHCMLHIFDVIAADPLHNVLCRLEHKPFQSRTLARKKVLVLYLWCFFFIVNNGLLSSRPSSTWYNVWMHAIALTF